MSEETALVVHVTPETAPLNRAFTLFVLARGNEIEEPVLPALGDLVLMDRSVQERENERIWVYSLMANREGPHRIFPVTVRIDGVRHRSKLLRVQVTPPLDTQHLMAEPLRPGDHQLSQEMLARLEVQTDRIHAYINEPVRLTLSRWTLESQAVQFAQFHDEGPDTTGFLPFPLPPSPERPRRFFDGWPYRGEVREVVLFPLIEGTHSIGSWRNDGTAVIIEGEYQLKQLLHLRTEPLEIGVIPLPPAPPGFTGAVGSFSAYASLSKRYTRQGEPVQLVTVIQGDGNPDAVGVPQVPDVQGLSVAGPRMSVLAEPGTGKVIHTKTFTHTFTPLREGSFTIPAYTFVHFSAQLEEYITTQLGPFTIQVTAVNEEEYTEIDASLAPLLDIQTPLRPARSYDNLFLCLLIAPPVSFALASVWILFVRAPWKRRAVRFNQHAIRKRLTKAVHAVDPIQTIRNEMILFVTARFATKSTTTTVHDVRLLLTAQHIPAEITKPFCDILERCERHHFGAATLENEQITSFLDQVLDAVERMDAFLGKERN